MLTRLLTALTASCALASLAHAQTVAYHGIGCRHEQDLFVVQRNVPVVGAATGVVTVPAVFSGNRRIFVRFASGSSSNDISTFDIKMHFQYLPELVRAWIYSADTNNEPDTALREGLMDVGGQMRYCRATFDAAVTVQPNRLYFMAFELPLGETLNLETLATSSASAVTYFVTKNGAPQQAALRYGLHANGPVPRITLEQPRIGQPCSVDLAGASVGPNMPAVLWFQMTQPGYPLSLYPFGSWGCSLYLDIGHIQIAGIVAGNNTRQRHLQLLIPNAPWLVGVPVFFQWQLATSDTNIPAGWVMSDMASATIL